MKADIIAICLPKDKIKIEIRVRRNYVSPDAKCVFLYKRKKYDSLCLDKRLIAEREEIAKEFEAICTYFSNNSIKVI